MSNFAIFMCMPLFLLGSFSIFGYMFYMEFVKPYNVKKRRNKHACRKLRKWGNQPYQDKN
jgi:hypothetical protein